MIHSLRHVYIFSTVLTVLFVILSLSLFVRGSKVRGVVFPLVVGETAFSHNSEVHFPPGADKAVAPLGGVSPRSDAQDYFNKLNERFRLAGFRISVRNPSKSGAIIEDLNDGTQWMRRKGEFLTSSVYISSVGTNSVTLDTPHGYYVLFQSKRGEKAKGLSVDMGVSHSGDVMSRTLSSIAEGERTPGTWHLRRDDVLAYFNEVRERPERLEAVFDTLAPVWYTDENDGKQKIEGYRVEICGEEDFFKAVGFREGDIVREVNGIKMTNRYAAEELIRRFVQDDLKFAHIKMERDGEDIIQSYLVEE